MKVLVTGRSGQLAKSLVERATGMSGIDLVALGRPDLDLTDRDSTIRCIAYARPDIVISAAAYTSVDRAEDESQLANAINVTGAETVADAARSVGAPVIHVSSDYVFQGNGDGPSCEDSPTGPRSIYGQTKLDGERAVASANPRHVIVRTSWVYSPFGSNFVRSMLRLADQQKVIRVVCDQRGNPTSAMDLADGLLSIASQLGEARYGIYHLTGQGEASWASFARHILQTSRNMGGPFAHVVDISTDEFPAKARRPADSRLCIDKVANVFGLQPPDWRESTERVVARLLRGGDYG